MTFFYIILSTLAGGVLTAAAAGIVLALPAERIDAVLPRLISFSTGSLLGAAFLGMMPHASARLPVFHVTATVLLGILVFYILERGLLWRHCHKKDCSVHAVSGPLLVVGDSVHNFVDGVVIAGAFSQSTALGMLATLSTVAHELPQELGEFMVYLRAGYSRRRAFLVNVLSSSTALLGGVAGYFFMTWMHRAVPYVLAFAAAGFLYVALADLIPSQRIAVRGRYVLVDLFLLCCGITVIWVIVGNHSHG